MSGIHAVLLGMLVISVAAGPVIPPEERPAKEWSRTYVLRAEESEAEGALASRRIEIEPPASEAWMVEEVSKVETWDWACNCYRRVPSAEVVSARMVKDEESAQGGVVAVVLSIRPATVCSPMSPACRRASWQVTVTLRGKTKDAETK